MAMPEILSEREYEGGFFVTVHQSLVLNGQNMNRLALRLRNDMPFPVTGVRLRVVRTDVERKGREEREFDVMRIFGPPGEEFLLPDLALPAVWKAVEVRVVAVYSDGHAYTLSADGKRILMQPAPVRRRAAGFFRGKGGSVSRSHRRAAAIIVLAIVALAAAVLAAVLPGVIARGGAQYLQTEREYVEIQEHS